MVRALQAVVVSAAIVIAFMTGVVVLDTIADSAGTSTGGNTTEIIGVTGGSASFSSNPVTTFQFAKTSLNESVALSGASGSNVTIDAGADVGTDFSACTWGELDSSVVSNNNDAILLTTQDGVLWYNGTADQWQGYYYNVSSRNSYTTAVTATNPTTPTLVCLNAVGSYVNVTANTTAGPNTVTTADNIADYPANVSNWDGTVDETRVFDEPLNGTQRADWVSEPVLAVDGEAPAYRVTFDNFGSSMVYDTYFASGSATANGASVGTGLTGPAITEGTDFSVSGTTLSILSGSTVLDPTGEVLYLAFVSEGSAAFGHIVSAWASLGSMAALIPLLLITVAIITILRRGT